MHRRTLAILLTIGTSAISAHAQSAIETADFHIDGERIDNANASPGNWLSHGRTYNEQRHSPLDQITDENVGDLGLAWAYPTLNKRGHEATPIVVDGVMFFTLPWSVVVALDARTGEELWIHDPQVPRAWGRNACCDVVNRGVAIWKDRVYVGTIDGRLQAVDARSGELVWSVNTIDRTRPYVITGAPRIVKDKVIIGNGGAEYGVRGYFSAYDASTGEMAWRFYTVPGDPSKPFEHPELEEAAKTWNGEWWKIGGGGTAWDSMAFDSDLNTLYVGTGNGSPWNRELRSPGGGDNLYLSSILAINPDTGRLKWHYQTTPAENWDYTATQHIILADMTIEGKDRKVLMQAPKNGFFYILDRETGELLSAEPFNPVTWASHVDMETGRPVETEAASYQNGPQVIVPSSFGAHNWHPMAYNPATKLVYIPTIFEPFLWVNQENFEYNKGAWNTGVDLNAAINMLLASGEGRPEIFGNLKAWDPIKQEAVWEVKQPTISNGGVLSTAGNLVFQGTGDGRFAAYSADKGEKRWEVKTNVGIVAAPVSYSIGDDQYIAVLTGWGGVPSIIGNDFATSAAVEYANMGAMLVFKLGGAEPIPEALARRTNLIPAPPASNASAETIAKGQELYHAYCFQCHGILAQSAGVISDLRYTSSAAHENFEKIVLEGVLGGIGMARFDDLLTKEDVKAIHAYIIQRTNEDRALQQEATKN